MEPRESVQREAPTSRGRVLAGRKASVGRHRSDGAAKPHGPKFTGKEAGLGDEYIYSYTEGPQAGNQYRKTTDEIIRYVGGKYKSNPEDVVASLRELEKPKHEVDLTTAPARTAGVPSTEYEIWSTRLRPPLDEPGSSSPT